MDITNERSFAHEFTGDTLEGTLDVHRRTAGWLIGFGIAMVLVGAYAVIQFLSATVASVYVLGMLMVLGGLVFGGNAFIARRWNVALLDVVAAVLYVLVGAFALSQPLAAAAVLTVLLAGVFIVQGVLRIIGSLAMTPSHWGWLLFSGVMSLILGGIVLAQWPASTLWLLGTLVGIELLFAGFSMLSVGFAVHRAGHIEERRATV